MPTTARELRCSWPASPPARPERTPSFPRPCATTISRATTRPGSNAPTAARGRPSSRDRLSRRPGRRHARGVINAAASAPGGRATRSPGAWPTRSRALRPALSSPCPVAPATGGSTAGNGANRDRTRIAPPAARSGPPARRRSRHCPAARPARAPPCCSLRIAVGRHGAGRNPGPVPTPLDNPPGWSGGALYADHGGATRRRSGRTGSRRNIVGKLVWSHPRPHPPRT